MQEVQTKQRRVQVPRMSASKRFGRYKKEEKKEERQADVKHDHALEKIICSYKRFFYLIDELGDAISEKRELSRNFSTGFIEHINYSSRTVERFSAYLMNEQTDLFYAGFFIGALVSNGRNSKYQIITSESLSGVRFLTLWTPKRLVVNGHGGGNVGFYMGDGMLVINGDVYPDVGHRMTGGIIHVNGNVVLDPKGEVFEPGFTMQGGEIHIEGEMNCEVKPHDIKHGKIYHKGKLIVDK